MLAHLVRSRPRRRPLCALVAVALGTSSTWAVLASPTEPPRTPIAVAGRAVADVESGSGLAGARVRLLPVASEVEQARLEAGGAWPPAAVAEAETDAAGWFLVEAPGPGWWEVEVAAPGRVARSCRLAPLVEETVVGAVPLEPAVTWTVRVEEPSGNPAAGARVSVRFGELEVAGVTGFQCRPADREAATDREGLASFELPRGTYGAAVSAAGAGGVATGLARLVSPAGEGASRQVRLRLPRARAHDLAVRDPRGDPLSLAGAVAMDALGRGLGPLAAGGRLEVSAEPGRPRPVLIVTADGAAGWGAAGERRRLIVVPPANWNPRVVDVATGRPVPGAVVGLSRRVDLGGSIGFASAVRRPLAMAVTGVDGRATLTVAGAGGDDAPGDLELWASAPGYLPARRRVEAAERRARKPAPAVELVAEARVEGVVVDPGGKPLGGTLVTVEADSGFGHGAARTGADGRFALGGMPRGAGFSLVAALDGYTRGSAHRSRTASADDLRVVLEPLRSLVGRVVDEAGRPLAGARVGAVPGGAMGLRMPRYGFARQRLAAAGAAGPVATGDEGRFALAGMAPGRATVAVSASGYAARLLTPVEIPAGAERPVDLGEIVLEPEAVLEGQVTDPAGAPIAGVHVGVTEGAAAAAAALRAGDDAEPAARTEDDGRFRLGELTPGERIDLDLRHPDYDGRVLRGVDVPASGPLVVVLRPFARIEGRVVDEEGRPVAGATVQALADDGGGRGGATEVDGTFRISCEAGRLRVGAAAPGRSAASTPTFQLAAGEVRSGIELVLPAGAELTGRVLDGRDRPLPAAIVLWRPEAADPGAEAMRQGFLDLNSTDEGGRFRIEGLAAGTGTLVVVHEVLGALHRPLELTAGAQEVEVRYAEAADLFPVSGRVVDETGAGVANSWVTLEPRAGGSEGTSALSDPDGSFTLDEVPAGSWKLTASPPGHFVIAFPAEGASLDLEVAGPLAGLVLRLPGSATISGRVLGVSPEELPAVSVWGESARGRLDSVIPDAGGVFRLTGVPPGRWRLVAIRPSRDGERTQALVEISAGQREESVDLDFGGSRVLAGRVTRGEVPVTDGAVALQGADSYWAPLDVRGEFRFGGLAEGRYQLAVRGERGATLHRETVEVTGEEAFLEIEIAPAALVGRVVDEAQETPLADARVELVAVESTGREPVGRATSDGDGVFRFTQAPPGTVAVRASAAGHATAEAEVELVAGETAAVELALPPGAVARFTVTGPDGRPPFAVAVELRDDGGGLVHSGSYEVGEGGAVEVAEAPPGTWSAVVASWGTGGVRAQVTVPGPPVAVALPLAARLLVEVPELVAEAVAGGPATAARVQVLDRQGLPAPRVGFDGGEGGAGAVALRWGEAVVEGLPPGPWTVTATAADGRAWTAAVVLQGGEAATVRLR